jgi:hypothetical protein
MSERSESLTPTRTRWVRIPDGYACGKAEITDNGAGFGPAKGSGRWAVTVAGKWVDNVDTKREAMALAAKTMGPYEHG